ncbi:MAG: 4-hydroxy-tetrahydrodipicolinate reductase [Deltaproteobacteria bacterium]|nr:4-hydroxy-tetrahydrodipicolinate reductase [Deltaproteobacteria bacterium]
MSELTLALFGAIGRMGRRLAALSGEHGWRVVGALVEPADAQPGRTLRSAVPELDAGRDVLLTSDPQRAVRGAAAVIDFALASGLRPRLDAAVAARAAYVLGATGLSGDDQAALDAASREIPLLWAPNMSQGIGALLELVARAAAALPDFEVEVHELHHRHKADAPSGTAIALADAAAAARAAGDSELLLCRGRNPGPRRAGEIGVVATRGGDAVGEHTVFLFGAGERVELTHRATSRDIFAHGALRAARFLVNRQPGRYAMADVLATHRVEKSAPAR